MSRTSPRRLNPVLIGLFALFPLACDTSPGATPADIDQTRHPLGKTDAIGSCDSEGDGNSCGRKSTGNCWCDEYCTSYGDCCSDYEAVCHGTASSGGEGSTTGGSDDGAGEDSGGSEPVSIWDDALLGGTPMTADEAVAFFEPGSTVAPGVGAFTVQQRVRSCNATTGCTAWIYPSDVTLAFMSWKRWLPGPGWSPQTACHQFRAASYPVQEGALDLYVGSSGKVGLRLHGDITGDVDCNEIVGALSTCGDWSSHAPVLGPEAACSVPNYVGPGVAPEAYPSSVTLYDPTQWEGKRIRMNLLVTASYAYGRSSHKGLQDNTGAYKETEYALYGSLDGSPLPQPDGGGCTPTTCEAQGANCGTIDDGCGGTLQCGSCGYPYLCGDDNTCEVPEGCNLQPCYAGASVGYTCCGSGQVTCSNGSGCTCYDACF